MKLNPKKTLKKIEAHWQRQLKNEIAGISPSVIRAVQNLDKMKSAPTKQIGGISPEVKNFEPGISKSEPGILLFSADRDFIAMMYDYREIHGCSGLEAHRAIFRMFPEALERCIREANQGR